ncbi:hypothetical protein BTM25_11680 [Actinomadura rubteroloni]|uniref:GH16 domain-containing protein n=1 Tax=Actinomadura rubteroloni TaxID=1926885 RepID=A0A2P4UNY6_9ACTN|nr:hypothetical protein [Actinomadura rubteroloni]POM26761.1 hypothetical protein BTM25_11680 [Actinomadura rubteroloni]
MWNVLPPSRLATAVVLVLAAGGCGLGAPQHPPAPRDALPVTTVGPGGRPYAPSRGRVPLHDTFERLDLGTGRRWGWRSAAYPDCTTNRKNFKLDSLSRAALSTPSGRLAVTASPLPGGRWRTGLLSTGDSCGSGGDGFEVRTGDVITTRVRLPTARYGAWPGIWTWRQGGNEVDVFEWHSDRPNTLEFANHVKDSACFCASPLVRRGAWLDIAVRLGARRVTWYLGRPPGPLRAVHSDRKGVGARFHAHLVIGMSVDDGTLHFRPDRTVPFTFEVASITVRRSGVSGRAGATEPAGRRR